MQTLLRQTKTSGRTEDELDDLENNDVWCHGGVGSCAQDWAKAAMSD